MLIVLLSFKRLWGKRLWTPIFFVIHSSHTFLLDKMINLNKILFHRKNTCEGNTCEEMKQQLCAVCAYEKNIVFITAAAIPFQTVQTLNPIRSSVGPPWYWTLCTGWLIRCTVFVIIRCLCRRSASTFILNYCSWTSYSFFWNSCWYIRSGLNFLATLDLGLLRRSPSSILLQEVNHFHWSLARRVSWDCYLSIVIWIINSLLYSKCFMLQITAF